MQYKYMEWTNQAHTSLSSRFFKIKYNISSFVLLEESGMHLTKFLLLQLSDLKVSPLIVACSLLIFGRFIEIVVSIFFIDMR